MRGHPGSLPYLLLFGPATLSWGLTQLREKREIEDTPISKVRSAAMGTVALDGEAQPRKAVESPVSGLPCCWWRCVIQEYKSNGKNSSWEDVKRVESRELFYIQDDTDRVLVDPSEADMRVEEDIVALDSVLRMRMGPVLGVWGVANEGWFEMPRRLRIKESVIYPADELYVFGELTHCYDHLEERKQRFLERIQEIKKDSAQMAAAGVVKDGAVDVDAWDAFRHKQEEDFLRQEAAREEQTPPSDRQIVRKSPRGLMVVDTRGKTDLLGSLGTRTFLGVFGGIAVSGLGVWLAAARGCPGVILAGMAAAGAIVGFVVGKYGKGGTLWG